MELGDFAYFIWVPLLLIPLAAIYISLRYLKWEPRARLFLDAWHIWFVWIIATIVSYISLGIGTEIAGFYWSISNFWWALATICSISMGNFLFIDLFVTLLHRRKSPTNLGLLESLDETRLLKPKATRVALVTTFAVVGSMTISFGLGVAVQTIYDHYHPKPEVEFGVYDI